MRISGVQLRGNTTRLSVETMATARLERQIYEGKGAMQDDGSACLLTSLSNSRPAGDTTIDFSPPAAEKSAKK
jgi:hypothetical protein